MVRDEMDDEGLRVRWVNTKQQLADALTKGSLDAAVYLQLVAKTAVFSLVEDERLSEQVAEHKAQQRRYAAEGRDRQHQAKALMKGLEQKSAKTREKEHDQNHMEVEKVDGEGDHHMEVEKVDDEGDIEMEDAQVGDLCVVLVNALMAATALTAVGVAACPTRHRARGSDVDDDGSSPEA